MKKYLSHKNLNLLLSLIVMGLSAYILITPFLPEVEYQLKGISQNNRFSIAQNDSEESEDTNDLPENIDGNRLIIPGIYLDSKILEGENLSVIDAGGVWRRPQTSTPTDGGNTVIVAHRYFGRGQNEFYHLNKLEVGDEIHVYWKGTKYSYKINDTYEVLPEQTEVEDNTVNSQLTLYTCSGLDASRRLIVTADLITT